MKPFALSVFVALLKRFFTSLFMVVFLLSFFLSSAHFVVVCFVYKHFFQIDNRAKMMNCVLMKYHKSKRGAEAEISQ